MTIALTTLLILVALIAAIFGFATEKPGPVAVAAGIFVYLHAVSVGVLG